MSPIFKRHQSINVYLCTPIYCDCAERGREGKKNRCHGVLWNIYHSRDRFYQSLVLPLPLVQQNRISKINL